jgi:hypothetical protein
MKKNLSPISVAAFAVGISAGLGAWWAFNADEVASQQATHTTAPAADPGVGETEASLPAAAHAADATTADVGFDPQASTPIGGVVPVVRSPRTTPPLESRAVPARRALEPDVEDRAIPGPATPAPANGDAAIREPVRHEPERVEVAEPVAPRFVELTVPTNAVLGVRLNTSLSSDTAEVEDRVEATVTRDVIAQGGVAIPAGTRVLGSVNAVTRGGKFRERARLSVRFHTLVLGDGTRESIRVDSIVREGDAPARESAAKIGGGAVGGAIIGGIVGGRKGAILGGAAGAGAGTAAVAAGDRSVATLTAGSPLSVRLDGPITIRREQ